MIRTLLAGVGLIAIVAVTAITIDARDKPQGPRPARLAVSFTGLNLNTVAGIAALEGQIADAIYDICGGNKDCRRSAYIGTRPQVARALTGGNPPLDAAGNVALSFSIEPQLLDLPADQRRWIDGPMLTAFEKGRSVPWAQWPHRGYISISQASVFDGVECRDVTVTYGKRSDEVVIARGLRCFVPGLLPKPIVRRRP